MQPSYNDVREWCRAAKLQTRVDGREKRKAEMLATWNEHVQRRKVEGNPVNAQEESEAPVKQEATPAEPSAQDAAVTFLQEQRVFMYDVKRVLQFLLQQHRLQEHRRERERLVCNVATQTELSVPDAFPVVTKEDLQMLPLPDMADIDDLLRNY